MGRGSLILELVMSAAGIAVEPDDTPQACPDPLIWVEPDIPPPAGGVDAWPDETLLTRVNFFVEDGNVELIDAAPSDPNWGFIIHAARRLRFPTSTSGVCFIDYTIDYPAMKEAVRGEAH